MNCSESIQVLGAWCRHAARRGCVAGLFVLLAAGCGGGGETTPPPGGNNAPPASVVVEKRSMFLSAVGQTATLGAQVLDAQGAPTAGRVSWISSAPDKISVDGNGMLVAQAVGSAQIVAEVGGLRSAPVLVLVAQPKPGALLVSDAQVVAIGAPRVAAGASPGVPSEYEVTLQGVATPAAGSVVLAAETAPVAGKVIATRQDPAGLIVTLEIAPIYELFSAYDIKLNLDLAAYPVEAIPDRAGRASVAAMWQAQRGGRAHAMGAAHPLAALEPFRAFDCDASLKPQLLGSPLQLSFENKLELILEDRPGYTKHVLQGSAALVGSAGLDLKAGFKASGRCDAQVQIKFPIFGWFSMLVMPAVRLGLGAEVEGEVRLVQASLAVEGKVGFSPVLGWECGGAAPSCQGLSALSPFDNFKTKSKFPSSNDPQAKISVQFYLLAGLDATFALGTLNAGILEARVGPKQSFDLAFDKDQAARADYASDYDLKLEGTVEPGAALKKAIEKVIGDDSTTVKFSADFSTLISESPKGVLAASKPRVAPGTPVVFTVTLDAKTVEYWQLGYNVTGIELFRKREDEPEFTPWKSMPMNASNQSTFTYTWTPANGEVGKYEFAAFVNTQLLTPLLEIAPNSIQPVEVVCFSGGAALAGVVPPPLDKRAAGQASAQPLAATCDGSWVGTATVVGRTPGQPPSDNITATSSVTWAFDKALENGTLIYVPRSGSFTLAFNNPSSGCTIALSPNTFNIVNDPVAQPRLVFDNTPLAPRRYFIAGRQLVNFTSTVSCPGEPNVVNQFVNYLADYASGTGPYADEITLEGTSEDPQFTLTWSFTRQ
jgi:hypothetical protein